jgi:hypothetical protein
VFGASSEVSLGAGAGGGAGGSFMTVGGDGGNGDNNNRGGGTAGPMASAPTVLRAGCDGQRGGAGDFLQQAGAPGLGGGVVYLLAQGTLSITSTGIVNVSGSGASGDNTARVGGSGAGSGGMMRLWATNVAFDSACKLIANGGGGSSGASGSMNSSNPGNDPDPSLSVDSVAGGGTGGGGAGGNGYAIGTDATNGAPGPGGRSGGGGGGGGGYILSNLSLGAADASGVIDIVP